MTATATTPPPPAVRLNGVSLRYGKTLALDCITLDMPSHCVIGMIGPDGVGKSSLLSLISGARAVQDGLVEVLGGDMRDRRHREDVCPRIAYMPQGLGKNLYPTLSIEENLQFFARLFGQNAAERRQRIDMLTKSTGLYPFLDRPAGKLSGGMKQKLGLCCSLIHDPDLLILDEPTTGVDPLARSQFWDLIRKVRRSQPNMSVIVATAYMDEAAGFDWLLAIDDGKIISTGTPAEMLKRTRTKSLESAFIEFMPAEKKANYQPVVITPMKWSDNAEIAIEAKGLTKRFGAFTAVDDINFKIPKGEIFGFLGSNGCGKTTTMKMLTGLLPASSGKAWLFGHEVDPDDIDTRRRLGYMSQAFSLYGELTVFQNLMLHARLFGIPEDDIPERVEEMIQRFGLEKVVDALPESIPLGVRQRLSLAVAVVHKPEVLILDEPTSGVDPIARDDFWRLIIELSRRDMVTIFVTTHFMNEAERCDRISLMHAGKSLACDTPAALKTAKNAPTLEKAFIDYLLEAGAGTGADGAGDDYVPVSAEGDAPSDTGPVGTDGKHVYSRQRFSLRRFASCMWREHLELCRDPIRATLALLGSLILMLVMGFGITMDVEDLRYAVLDRDQTGLSRDYTLNIAGSRYFIEQPPINNYAELDRRMRSGEISLAIEIPSGFGQDVQRNSPTEIAVWIDGAMPMRAETINGYMQGMHLSWLTEQAKHKYGMDFKLPATIETRFRYNPDVKSLPAMVPGVIPILLLMIPAILAALAVVREKELGSIINLYVTPLTRTEFMLGKQAPYVLLSMASFVLLVIMSVLVFDVPVKGSLGVLFLGTLLYCCISTGMGLLASTITRSQIAVMFLTIVATLLPAVQFSGLINSVSSLTGMGRFVGTIYPTTHMLVITRGVFNKALAFTDLYEPILVLMAAVPIILGTAIILQKKQD